MDSITVIFTCFNRKEKTKRCLESVRDDQLGIRYIITDDCSSDGTAEMLEEEKKTYNDQFTILRGNGNLFWSGGMRMGMGHYLEAGNDTDYVALVNDDVVFEKNALSYMIKRSKEKNNAVIVGVTKDSKDQLSYGGVKYREGTVKCDIIPVEKADDIQCDTFNCNCVVIPNEIFKKAGNFDDRYVHAMSDYDYGFTIKNLGYQIYETDRVIGSCDDNSVVGTWKDTSLKRSERLKKKETPKGLPRKEYYYYLRKNFGLRKAIWHSITPYVRIFLGI